MLFRLAFVRRMCAGIRGLFSFSFLKGNNPKGLEPVGLSADECAYGLSGSIKIVKVFGPGKHTCFQSETKKEGIEVYVPLWNAIKKSKAASVS